MSAEAVAWLEDQFNKHWRLTGRVVLFGPDKLRVFVATPPHTDSGKSVTGGQMFSLKDFDDGGDASHWCVTYDIGSVSTFGTETEQVDARCDHGYRTMWLRVVGEHDPAYPDLRARSPILRP